jgi:DNA replication protein DnaC
VQPMEMPEKLLKSITFSSDYCDKHKKPIQLMVIEGKNLCPRCETQKLAEEITVQENERVKELDKHKNRNIFYTQSLITDNTILKATLENYKTELKEEITNLNDCKDFAQRFINGQVFNVFLAGVQGAGKSHLGYGILRDLNESLDVSCLFVNVEDMLRKIRGSFSDKTSKYTEEYFVKLLSEVDYLVLDDLGAETGAIGTDKTATDFVQRILYAVTSARQDKVTISTTNLSSETLFNMYDKKLVSRLLRNPKYVLFKETKDKRMSSIPF